MPNWVGKDAIRATKAVCLYDYLLLHHPDGVVQDYDCLRLKCDNSVVIRTGWSGYYDFASGEGGDGIRCLTDYFGYSFQSAVGSLCEFGDIPHGRDLSAGPQTIDLADLSRPAPQRPTLSPAAALEALGGRSAVQGIGIQAALQRLPEAPRKPFVRPEPDEGPCYKLFSYLNQARGIPVDVIRMLIG